MTATTRTAVMAVSFVLLWQAGGTAFARGAAEDVAAGNAAFSRGDSEQAISLYDRARRAAPGSPVPLLNFGIALYAKGDYAAALAAFQEIRSSDGRIAAEAHYDQGNALAQLGRKAEKDQPEAALDFYQRSVAAYKRALAFDPNMSAAAVNVEVVRGWIKALKDAQAQASNGGQQAQPQDQGSAANQGSQPQAAPSPNAQQPSGPGTPGQGQQAPGSTPGASGQTAAPQDETPEAILREELDRRQSEATAGGNTANASPNW